MPSSLDVWQATAGFPTGSIAVATETVMPLLTSCSSYHAINWPSPVEHLELPSKNRDPTGVRYHCWAVRTVCGPLPCATRPTPFTLQHAQVLTICPLDGQMVTR